MSISPAWAVVVNELSLVAPMIICAALATVRHGQRRVLVAALFSLLYLLGVMMAVQVLAPLAGWWHYGMSNQALLGMPVALWLGWSLTCGPLFYLLFPKASPWWLAMLVFVVDIAGMLLLDPLVIVGPHWLQGKLCVLVVAVLPAQYLARWTAEDRFLACRASLLAIGYGCCAFLLLPSVIMLAMGGSWRAGMGWPLHVYLIGGAGLLLCTVMGLSAVQLFVVHGDGTPIPLDNTKRLVHAGLYGYLSNPMQLGTALTWLLLGAMIRNFWVCAAAGMAFVFVQGLVRWHHRQDLAIRFPQAWQEYRINVPSWIPRWHPWVPKHCYLQLDPARRSHRWLARWLASRTVCNLLVIEVAGTGLQYQEQHEPRAFYGVAAFAKVLSHVHFGYALAGAALLLGALLVQVVANAAGRSTRAVA